MCCAASSWRARFPGRFLRDQNGNEGITQPFLVAVGTPFAFDDRHPVDVAGGEGPKNVPRFFLIEPGSEPTGFDEKGDGRALGIVPAAFLFLLDGRQFRNNYPGLAQYLYLVAAAAWPAIDKPF